jgi:hypothetical protein
VPAVSKSQFGMMGVLYRKHKISRSQLEDYNKGVSGAKYKALPDHVKKHKAQSRAAKLKRRSK